jgi:hypothetical protein
MALVNYIVGTNEKKNAVVCTDNAIYSTLAHITTEQLRVK